MERNITYLSEIKLALTNLGGVASLKEINQYIESRNNLPAIRTNMNWQRNVSAVIQRHCKETKSYNGGENLFYSVYGLGEGFWGLIELKGEINSVENSIEKRICERINTDEKLKITEKEMLIKARKGQGIFRDKIIEKYHHCIITGIVDKRLLIASHIHPWRSANNYQRLSEENGLLLSPLYDKLFDTGLISFNDNMKILVSKELNETDLSKLNLDTELTYIRMPSKELKMNMEYHRDVIFLG